MEQRPSSRRKKNSAKVNLTFSAIFHGLIIAAITFWAAHEGVLGNKLREITVALVPKEKPPEPEKLPPRVEPPKEEPPKIVDQPKIAAATPVQTSPPASGGNSTPTAVAPAAAIPADFGFDDGAKVVETSTNAPVLYYKNLLEYTLRSNWERPPEVADDSYVAEVEVQVDNSGRITGSQWMKGSGDKKWDDSVKRALAATKTVNREPPKGFPNRFLVRFDVLPATEPLLQ